MALDDLVRIIETLKRRIQDHGRTLSTNETRTRAALIDPMLSALGWDTADPVLVEHEHKVDVGWADYALLGSGGRATALIEAKRLGSIVEHHLDQVVGYCLQRGIAYAGVTDGSHWRLYRIFDPKPMEEKIVLDVDIRDHPSHECALQLLMLWRPKPVVGDIDTPAEASVDRVAGAGIAGGCRRTIRTRARNRADPFGVSRWQLDDVDTVRSAGWKRPADTLAVPRWCREGDSKLVRHLGRGRRVVAFRRPTHETKRSRALE